MSKPTVGAIVHYVSYGTPGGEYTKQCRAAIVTAVNGRGIDPGTGEEAEAFDVDLCVLNPIGMFFNQHCMQMEHAHDGGTWHWPEGDV
ncbi:hypothetical protein AB0I27_22635 [Streptomyces sp. NPDC050597]|uniref:hypothetical protein n=1 Tax=Streptomyces sp. NPDC050597 TaxID=3157212 RepID=UPI003449CEE7